MAQLKEPIRTYYPFQRHTYAYNEFPTFRGFSWKERDYHYRHVWAAPFGAVQSIKIYSTHTHTHTYIRIPTI